MFINSIFLPKINSDQQTPEGFTGEISNFSHLFSNVFHIVKDDQEKSQPFKLDILNPESIENTPNELLKVSLLSNNQSNLENINISMIIKSFLLKLNPGENAKEPVKNNKAKVNDNVPKYFSLNKKDFIKEIKDIIESLKSGEIKNLGNVEISLIANGQSIKINPLGADIDEIENWANAQLKSNSDFEILVKSGQKKLFVDIEPVKMESSKTFKPVKIVSINTSDDSYAQNKSIVDNNRTELPPGLTITSRLETASKQPLEGLKQTITHLGDQIVKQEISSLQIQGKATSTVNSKIIFDKNIASDESVIIKSEMPGKVALIDPVNKNDLAKEFIPESSLLKENILIDSKGLSQKKVNTENQVDNLIKDISNELKVKPNSLQSDETLNNIKINNKTSEVNVNKISNPEMNVTVKSNQKINSILTNKYTSKENVALNDLIKKTDVKEIDANIQKYLKTNSTNAPKIQNEYHSEISSIKNNEVKPQAPTLTAGVKKDILSNQETKQPTVKKSLEAESVKTEKTLNSAFEQKQKITKLDLNTKIAEPVKAQNTSKIKGQLGLGFEEKLADNEKGATTNYEKSGLPKIESTKTNLNNQQTVKVNSANEPVAKSTGEKNDLERIKILQVNSLEPKVEINEGDTSGKSLTQEIKTEQKTVGFKSTLVITEDESIKVQNSGYSKEVIKENVKGSNKETVSTKTNTGTIISETKQTELSSSNNSKTISKIFPEQSEIENLRTSLKENQNDETRPGIAMKTQFENKNVKIDLMQRRIYSQIPQLEVIAEDTELKNLQNKTQNIDANKNNRTIDESIKSKSLAAESKTNNEKQVWVKLSLEKPENENVSEVKRQAPQQGKITIDTNNDGLKKDSDQNNYFEKESNDTKNFNTHNISVDNTNNKEQKPVLQNQTIINEREIVSNIKPELKTEDNFFKSTLHSGEARFNSRGTEMVEKIKYISSGEMIREVYKVFESGEKQSIVLRLIPKELGSIKITLDTIDNVLNAKVEVQNETVGNLIRSNYDQLKQNLLQNGVHINSLNISYQNSDQKQHGFNNQKRKNSVYLPDNDIEEVDDSLITKKMGYNTYEYLA